MAHAQLAEQGNNLKIHSIEALEALRHDILSDQDPNRPLLIVCHGTGCLANGSPKVSDALRKAIAKANFQAKVIPGIKTTGCHGFCSRGPLVIIKPAGLFYQQVKAGDAEEIVNTTLLKGDPVERLLYHDPTTKEPIPLEKEIPFYKF